MSLETFADYEKDGWHRRAAEYDEFTLPATRQAFEPLLDSVGPLAGRRVLELASGTGHLAQLALARGAAVVGADVAPNMVALARQRVPGAEFHEGDAEALPFPDGSFDVVLCCFGLLHLSDPARGLREAARVLKPGGLCAFTVWYGPDRGSEFFRLIFDVFQAHAQMDVGLPAGPPMFALADTAIREPMLIAAGFDDIQHKDLPIVWPVHGPQTVFHFVTRGSVRSGMVYERQAPDAQQQIRDALVARTLPYSQPGRLGIPCPALLVTARRGEVTA